MTIYLFRSDQIQIGRVASRWLGRGSRNGRGFDHGVTIGHWAVSVAVHFESVVFIERRFGQQVVEAVANDHVDTVTGLDQIGLGLAQFDAEKTVSVHLETRWKND